MSDYLHWSKTGPGESLDALEMECACGDRVGNQPAAALRDSEGVIRSTPFPRDGSGSS